MRKGLLLAGLILLAIGGGGWFFFMSLPTAGNSMSGEAALGWLTLYSIITLGALLLGVIGLVLIVLGLVLGSNY